MLKMVDLQAAHARLEPALSNAIKKVVESGVYIRGSEVKALETELSDYVGAARAITCANGTEALQIALMSLCLEPGDEVITPSFSFIAVAEVCLLLGLKPVFADVEDVHYNVTVNEIERLITPRTKVIVPVHLFGCPAPMEQIMDLAERRGLTVIEDAAQALGAECYFRGSRRKVGSIGHIGCTSFFPTKNLGCMGDGGAIFTSDEALAKRIAAIANHGSERKYHATMVGLNSRLDELQAAILRIKLRHLDEAISRRRAAALAYRAKLKGNDFFVPPADADGHTFNQFTLRVNYSCRDDVREFLTQREIPTMVYYPEAIHRQPVFANGQPELPVTEALTQQVLSLPMHSELSEEHIARVTNALNAWHIGAHREGR